MTATLAPTGTHCDECEHEGETIPASYVVQVNGADVLVCDAHLDILAEG